MYFSRYIWIFIEKIYFKRKRKKSFIKNIKKFPSIQIPSLFHFCRKKKIKKYKKFNLIFFKKIDILRLNLINIIIYLNKYLKYKYKYIYTYNIIYILNYIYNKYKKKIKYRRLKKYLFIHNGKKIIKLRIWIVKNTKLTLSTLTETITYGSKKKKIKQQKKKSKPKVQPKQKIKKK